MYFLLILFGWIIVLKAVFSGKLDKVIIGALIGGIVFCSGLFGALVQSDFN